MYIFNELELPIKVNAFEFYRVPDPRKPDVHEMYVIKHQNSDTILGYVKRKDLWTVDENGNHIPPEDSRWYLVDESDKFTVSRVLPEQYRHDIFNRIARAFQDD